MHMKRQDLRKRILAARDRMSAQERHAKSIAVTNNFWSVAERQDWSTLFVYVNFRSEVETLELIRGCFDRGINVAVPLVDASKVSMIPLLIHDLQKDLVPGYYGILEPDPEKSPRVNPCAINAAVIPGSVFDIHGGRLGYGGGYYDRFLVNDTPQAMRIGFAFELQIVDKVPVEPHDQPLDMVITEKRIVDIRR